MAGVAMLTRFGQIFRAAICAIPIASCAVATAELPASAKPGVTCMYRVLKSAPGMNSVDVYLREGDQIFIEYTYQNAKNVLVTSELDISEQGGRYVYTGDFMSSSADPVSHVVSQLTSRCQLAGGYNDQVVIVQNEPWRSNTRFHVVMPTD